MNIEQAIKTAIEYEKKVRDIYGDAYKEAKDKVGKRVFGVMVKEEQQHIDYLHKRLDELQQNGKITVESIDTVVPAKDKIEQEMKQLQKRVEDTANEQEVALLQKALEAETQTSDFYRKMAEELDAEAQQMFANFVKIEEGHRAIVLAELDCLNGMGFWFDMREFDLEA